MRRLSRSLPFIAIALTGCIGGTVADDKSGDALNGVTVKARTCPTCSDQVTTTALYRGVQGAYRFDPYEEGNGLSAMPTNNAEASRFTLSKSGYRTLVFYNKPNLSTYQNDAGEERYGEFMGGQFLSKSVDWVDSDSDGLSDRWEARLGTNKNNDDTDGDGLEDGAEVLGANWIDYQAYGADPLHRDVFIEVDYEQWRDAAGVVHTAKLAPAAEKKLLDFYGSLPIANPDGKNGIALHLVYDTVLPFPADCSGEYDTTGDFDPLHREGFKYARICVKDDTSKSVVAGQGIVGGQRFYTSIGEVDRNSSNDETEARVFYQFAVFAHELGHTLGLSHGGKSGDPNCKPNYPSLMNYAYDYDFEGSPQSVRDTKIQFSSGSMPKIDEINGVPEVGWGPLNTSLAFLTSYDGSHFTVSGRDVDWNKNGSYSGSPKGIVRTSSSCGTATTALVLNDFNDIAQLKNGMGSTIPGAAAAAGGSDEVAMRTKLDRRLSLRQAFFRQQGMPFGGAKVACYDHGN